MEQQIMENLPSISNCIMTMLDNYNSGITKNEFYSKNIIDATDVTEEDMHSVNAEVIQYCETNGCYAALPPFEEGVFVDRSERRYTHWKVLDIQEDYFRIEFNHYPIIFVDEQIAQQVATGESEKIIHPCWYLACRTVIKVKELTTEEHMAVLSHHPDFEFLDKAYSSPEMLRQMSDYLKTECHIGGVIEEYEYYTPQALKKIAKKGKYYTSDGTYVNGNWIRKIISDSLAPAMDSGLNSMLFCSAGPIIEMMLYVNYLLSQKSTSTSTHRTVSSIYLPNTENPEIRKERHFGKLKVVSEKKPRSVNADNVHRVYTTVSWQRRGHLRHYASGKVVPVKSAICKRHNMDKVPAPQVVYKV